MAETRLSVRMSQEELDLLKNFANSINKTFADWVRETLLTEAGVYENRLAQLEERIAKLENKAA